MERRNLNRYKLTKYIQVNDKKAIQMEIYRTVSENCPKKSAKRIERKHLKEIENLLKDVIMKHVEKNDDSRSKRNSTEAKIMTGEMVRLGYTFKNKSANQTLLISDDSDEEDFYAHSVKIHSEKLVVYYYLLEESDGPSSPVCMSQMLKALGDGNMSQSQTGMVSISSYFCRKKTSKKDGECQSSDVEVHTSATDEMTDGSIENVDQPDHEEKRHTIKNMVKRSAPALSRRKHRKLVATAKIADVTYSSDSVATTKIADVKYSSDTTKIADVKYSSDTTKIADVKYSSDSVVQRQQCVLAGGTMGESSRDIGSGLRGSLQVDFPLCEERGSPRKILAESALIDNRESDFSSKSSLELLHSSKARHVLDLPMESKENFVPRVVIDSDGHSSCAVDTGFFRQNSSSCSVSTNSNSEDSSQSTESSKECEFVEVDKGRCGSFNKTNSGDVTHLDSDSDLPNFSFLKRTSVSSHEKQREVAKSTESNTHSDTDDVVIQALEEGSASPKFDRTKNVRPEKRPFCTLETSDEDSVNKGELIEKRLELKRQRVKQNFPVFTTDQKKDRTSDPSVDRSKLLNTEAGASRDIQVNEWDGLPVLSSSRSSKKEKCDKNSLENTHTTCDIQSAATSDQPSKTRAEVTKVLKDSDSGKNELFKRPNTNNVTEDRKPRIFSFKKSSSSNSVKRQSILSFLTLQEPEEISEEKSQVHVVVDCTDSDSLDCVIIDGLDDLKEPEFKDDESRSIEKEINDLRKVDELNEEHLHYLVMKNKVYLQDIFSGKVRSERHEVYKEGGRARKDLNHHVHLGLFTEKQLDVVMETLMSIFCKKHHKYLEYIMKVLLPEALIKIYMNFHKLSHEKAEEEMLEAVRTPGGIHV